MLESGWLFWQPALLLVGFYLLLLSWLSLSAAVKLRRKKKK